MRIDETGEVMNLERIPDPSEAEAFEVDVPQVEAPACATEKARRDAVEVDA